MRLINVGRSFRSYIYTDLLRSSSPRQNVVVDNLAVAGLCYEAGSFHLQSSFRNEI